MAAPHDAQPVSRNGHRRRHVSVTLRGHLDGFPVEITADVRLAQLPALVRRLRETGVAPATYDSVPDSSSPPRVDVPRCPLHGSPMKPSRKGGWYCPRQDDSGAYCAHSRAASAA